MLAYSLDGSFPETDSRDRPPLIYHLSFSFSRARSIWPIPITVYRLYTSSIICFTQALEYPWTHRYNGFTIIYRKARGWDEWWQLHLFRSYKCTISRSLHSKREPRFTSSLFFFLEKTLDKYCVVNWRDS